MNNYSFVTISLNYNTNKAFKTWKFPGGEMGVQFIKEELLLHSSHPLQPTAVDLFCRLSSSDDLMMLMLATDALKRAGVTLNSLRIPYMPYARQDRVTEEGGAFSLQVIGSIIDSLGFKSLVTLDIHSDVTNAVFKNTIFRNVVLDDQLTNFIDNKTALLAPDVGASKRVARAATKHNIGSLMCFKERTQEGIKIIPPTREQLGKYDKIIVYDDICDGGATFITLAKAIEELFGKDKRPRLELFVTHGIFSKGLTELFTYYDRIITTDSWQDFDTALLKERKLSIINCWNLFPLITHSN